MSKPADTDRSLVVAARRGDRRARDELARIWLPLVYNVVGRALNGPDVEDVVQEIMLRVVAKLPELRHPDRIRAWIMTIAVREIGAYRQRAQTAAPAGGTGGPDPGTDFEELAILRLRLSGERRRVAEAARWLDADDRTVLALWWQETTGQISRAELAAALETTVAYAAVRVQRMRTQLDRSRAAVAALQAQPRCRQLEAVVDGWDGSRSPLWRKRIDRHVRECPDCLRASHGSAAVERLLLGCVLVPVPAALSASVLAKVAGTAGASATAGHPLGHLMQALQANPLVATVAATVVVAAGAGAAYANRPEPQRRSQVIAAPAVRTAAPATATPARGATPTRTAAPKPSRARCGAGLSRKWASWPMPNSEAGLPHQARYTDRGNGTVRADVTCLTWQRAAPARTYTFTEANQYCAGLRLDGGGWHLPSRIELTSIVDSSRDNPAVDTAAFPGTPPRYFWTSSPWAVTKEPRRAWIINFYEGLSSNSAEQSQRYHVRCVRSAEGTGRPRYRIGGGQVTDPATGLTWQRATSDTAVPAEDAPRYCADLDLGGHSWRLPSLRELATTVDETRVSPAVDPDAFPDTAEDARYWTATRPAPEPALRWALNYDDGFTTYRKADSGYVRCVR